MVIRYRLLLFDRYVALREILMFYVGYESFTDRSGEGLVYEMSESLCEDHQDDASAPTSAPSGTGISAQSSRRNSKATRLVYCGRSAFSRKMMKAAETLLAYRLGSYTSEDLSDVDIMLLSPMAVRSLYALQLELDSTLPITVCAQCRVWAEERHNMRSSAAVIENYMENINAEFSKNSSTSKNEVSNGGGNRRDTTTNSGPSSAGVTLERKRSFGGLGNSPVSGQGVLLAILDGQNLMKGMSFGTSSSNTVSSFCTVNFLNWDGGRAPLTTKVGHMLCRCPLFFFFLNLKHS